MCRRFKAPLSWQHFSIKRTLRLFFFSPVKPGVRTKPHVIESGSTILFFPLSYFSSSSWNPLTMEKKIILSVCAALQRSVELLLTAWHSGVSEVWMAGVTAGGNTPSDSHTCYHTVVHWHCPPLFLTLPWRWTCGRSGFGGYRAVFIHLSD